MAKHLFEKGNQCSKGKGRPRGSASYRADLLAVIGKAEFTALVRHLYALAIAGDNQAASVLIGRLVPPLKPSAELIRFELPDGDALTQARAIVAGVAGGQLTPADGRALLDALAAMVRIQEVTDLIPRLEALEGQL